MKTLLLLFISAIGFGQTMSYNSDASGRLLVSNIDLPSGNTIANTTTETPFASNAIIPTTMWRVGQNIILQVRGTFGTALVVPSITGKVKLNSVIVGNTGSVATAASLTNKGWKGYISILVKSVGSSGVIDVQGEIKLQTTLGTEISVPIVNTSDINIDMTVSQTLTVTAQWGAVSTSNTITLRQFVLDF